MKKTIVAISLIIVTAVVLIAAGTRLSSECGSGSATEKCFVVKDASGNDLFTVTPTAVTSQIPFQIPGPWAQITSMGTLPAPGSGQCTIGANGTSLSPSLAFWCFGMFTPEPINGTVRLNVLQNWTATQNFAYGIIVGNTGGLGGARIDQHFAFSPTLGNQATSTFVTQTITTGEAANDDLTGQLVFAAAATATYTLVHTIDTVHRNCVATPEFDPGVGVRGPWITYTGTASFTVHFSANVTGNVDYVCVGTF